MKFFNSNRYLFVKYKNIMNENIDIVNIENCVKEIKFAAFSNTGISKIHIANSVTTIEFAAFSSCKSLTEIIIPNSVIFIGANAFRACASLIRVKISESVTNIAPYTFYGCENLINISIPKKLKVIDENAFYGCKNLSYIFIPDSVTGIGNGAFGGCLNLKIFTSSQSVVEILTGIGIPENMIFTPKKMYQIVQLEEFFLYGQLLCKKKILALDVNKQFYIYLWLVLKDIFVPSNRVYDVLGEQYFNIVKNKYKTDNSATSTIVMIIVMYLNFELKQTFNLICQLKKTICI